MIRFMMDLHHETVFFNLSKSVVTLFTSYNFLLQMSIMYPLLIHLGESLYLEAPYILMGLPDTDNPPSLIDPTTIKPAMWGRGPGPH